MRSLLGKLSLIAILVAMALAPIARAASSEYDIVQVDQKAGAITVKHHDTLTVLQVRADAEITVNGAEATLANLGPPMTVKITLAEPGVAQRLDANGLPAEATPAPAAPMQPQPSPPASTPTPPPSTPTPAPTPSMSTVLGSCNLTATIFPTSPDAYPLGMVRMGTKITFRYLSGGWKFFGHVGNHNPDATGLLDSSPASRLAISLPSTNGTTGQALAIVPTGTHDKPFTYEVPQDSLLVLRIGGKSGPNSPGHVVYDVKVDAPPVDGPFHAAPPPSAYAVSQLFYGRITDAEAGMQTSGTSTDPDAFYDIFPAGGILVGLDLWEDKTGEIIGFKSIYENATGRVRGPGFGAISGAPAEELLADKDHAIADIVTRGDGHVDAVRAFYWSIDRTDLRLDPDGSSRTGWYGIRRGPSVSFNTIYDRVPIVGLSGILSGRLDTLTPIRPPTY